MQTQQQLAHPRLPRHFWEALFEIYWHYTPRELKVSTWTPIWEHLMCLQDYLDVAREEGWLD
jgi:hypothetical protein